MSRTVREWTLTDEIGRGGMGVVYLATHEILHGDWAVKVIRPELSEDKESRLRFLQEASTLARMQHPNIVSIQTPFQEGGQIYLPMEFLNGLSLEQILKTDGRAWSAERAVNVIRQAAAGLGYAHRQSPPVLHRDIKPGNVQVLDDGRVKVLDFGLARTLGDKSMTGTGKAVGTPAYMAPEVLDGRKATERSDVYSLGVVLYRLLAGRLPFDMPEEDSSIQATFVAVIRGLERGLPDVREFAPLTPPALADLTMRTLSRSSEDRPANGADLAEFLSKIDVMSKSFGSTSPKMEYQADLTSLAIDLNAMAGGRSDVSVRPAIHVSGPNYEADRSLIGLDVGIPVKPVIEKNETKLGIEKDKIRPSRLRSVRLGITALVLLVVVVGCLVGYEIYRGFRASPEACQKSCSKFVELQKAEASPNVASVVDPVSRVEAAFSEKMAAMQKNMGDDLMTIQKQCDSADRASNGRFLKDLNSEACTKMKNNKAQEWAPKFAELSKAREDAIKTATEYQERLDKEHLAATEKQLADCVGECISDGISESTVACRLRATSIFYFNACN